MIRAKDCVLLAPPGYAAVIPAGTVFQSQLSVGSKISSVQLEVSPGKISVAHGHVVKLSSLGIELIASLASMSQTAKTSERFKLLTELTIDEVERQPLARLHLPIPLDPILAQTCLEMILGFSSSGGTGSSEPKSRPTRAWVKAFKSETSLSYSAWRRQAGLVMSVPRIVAGHSIGQVAMEQGYRSISAFSASFRKLVGVPPSLIFRAPTN